MHSSSPPIARISGDYGMSGRELAKHLGVTPSTAHRILRGERQLTLVEAAKAAEVLGCEVVDLIPQAPSAGEPANAGAA